MHLRWPWESTEDEVEAESRLAEAGIVPRNGWIADYPVTPDIVGEVRDSLLDAVDAGKLTKGENEALKTFDDVVKNSEFRSGLIPRAKQQKPRPREQKIIRTPLL